MPGRNTTGQPDVNDYLLGRGIIQISTLDDDGRPGAYRDLGNSPDFAVTVESETLDHEGSRTGLKVLDKQVTLRQGCGVRFSLDEFNNANLALAFSGEEAVHANPVAVAGFAEHIMIPSLVKGRWYDITNASFARAYNIDAADLTVEKDDTTDIPLVLNVDYLLDAVFGRIFILSTSSVVADGDPINVTLAAEPTAAAVYQVRGLTQLAVNVALKFIGENAADNAKKFEVQVHRVSLKVNGDLSMIGDDWGQVDFEGKAERNIAMDPNSGYITITTPD